MFEYFYNEILRRTIVSFGTLFNSLTIKQTNSSDNVINTIRVPLSYGPTQKFLARIEQQSDLNKATAITLPRMAFEFTGMTYDSARKVTTTQQYTVKDPDDGSESKKIYMPVPYNMQFELSIMTKLNDDALQIVEQILPYFQPAYNLTVELVDSIQEKRDIPVILENITMQDDYDGGYTGDAATTVSVDITKTNKIIEVESISGLTAKSYIAIDDEELFIKSITGNKLTVLRAQDKTTATEHLRGAEIHVINAADNALIEEGDDFGFSGTITWQANLIL